MRISLTTLYLVIICLCSNSTHLISQTQFIDTSELEAYFDGAIEAQMDNNNIAGGALSIVHAGGTVLLKGYGYANVENKERVDPDKTLFRIGSITKLFVWTAIMQLYSEGKLDLDDDVNQYFSGFQVGNNYDEIITIKHLMTHTPGFEDEIFGLFARSEESLKPLGEILQDEMPKRVRRPGKHSSYSNHGTGMAAYIVEKVSGISFDDYAEQKIFDPLMMHDITVRQPIPDHLSGQLSKGHAYEKGEFRAREFEYVPLAPVGAASASASSMARLMLMYLNHGSLEDAEILDSTTYELMTSPAHSHHPQANPMLHGFMDVSQNGERIIGHGGDTRYFHSLMALFPEHELGIFLSFNSELGGGVSQDILENFVDRFFPEEVASIDPSAQDELMRFEGEFAANRHSHDDLLKVAKLMSVTNIEATPDGYLKTVSGENVDYWVRLDNLTFRNIDNSDMILFEENELGKISSFFLGSLPIIAFDKLEGLDKVSNHTSLFTFCILVVLITFLYWSITYILRRRYKVERGKEGLLNPDAKKITWITLTLVLLFYLGTIYIFRDPFDLVYGMPTIGMVIFTLPFVVLVLTIILGFHVYRSWLPSSGVKAWRKVAFGMIWICLIVTLWQWHYWNVLGFKF